MENNINEHPIEKIISACKSMSNNRDLSSIMKHLLSETKELEDEVTKSINGETAGTDGVVGEAIDVILCAVDLIYQKVPSISKEYISFLVGQKIEKWETEYKDKDYSVEEV
jgi:hypothetical protein